MDMTDLISQPRPGYFLVRPSGKVVPLVAVDELPVEISLQGISKTLELEETVGMLNLGMVNPPDTPYKLLGRGNRFDDEGNKPNSVNIALPENPQASPGTTAPSNSPISPTSRTLKPNPQVCKHWCAYGICKWNEHCRYLHSMPSTRAALYEAGLYDWPTWYRAQNPGLFNALRRRGMIVKRGHAIERDPAVDGQKIVGQGKGGQGRRMIPDSRESLIADGRIVGFMRSEGVVEALVRLGGKERIGGNDGREREKTVEMGVKKDVAKEVSLVDM